MLARARARPSSSSSAKRSSSNRSRARAFEREWRRGTARARASASARADDPIERFGDGSLDAEDESARVWNEARANARDGANAAKRATATVTETETEARARGRTSDANGRARRAPARRASYVTGIYIGAVGCSLLVAPRATFGVLFSANDVSTPMIRVFGVLCAAFATYYIGVAYGDSRGFGAEAFYWSTVIGRMFVASALACVAVTSDRSLGLLALALINFLGASAMFLALLPR